MASWEVGVPLGWAKAASGVSAGVVFLEEEKGEVCARVRVRKS